MKKTVLCLVLCAAAVLAGAQLIEAGPVLEAFTYRADFESGSVGAWSSYPPSQDTAYDPTIWVKPRIALSGFFKSCAAIPKNSLLTSFKRFSSRLL